MMQKLEWMLRIPISQMEIGIGYLARVPDDKNEDLRKAMDAMTRAIRHIRRWCDTNKVQLRGSMKT